MRVTKLIKEYVEKKVSEIYDPRIAKVGAEYRERKATLEEQLTAFFEQADATAKEMIAEAGFELRYGRKTCIDKYAPVMIEEIEDEIRKETNDLKNEKQEKINDILLNLELGATRAELDEMLRNLQ